MELEWRKIIVPVSQYEPIKFYKMKYFIKSNDLSSKLNKLDENDARVDVKSSEILVKLKFTTTVIYTIVPCKIIIIPK